MNWFVLTLLSAATLGIYDICKKHAVRENSVMEVLFFATLCGSSVFMLLTCFLAGLDTIYPFAMSHYLLVWLKSILVAASWICVYYALRELPISIASPIRSSAPVWTFVGALILFREFPTWTQGLAMLLMFAGYVWFNLIGRQEGFSFVKSKSMHAIIAGTVLGAMAALFDKYLLGKLGIERVAMQFYFSMNLVVIFGVILWLNRYWGHSTVVFRWRWSIPVVGILLIVADYLYFQAVSMSDAPISQISLLRRTSCVLTFFLGAWLFRDKNIWLKAVALGLIFAGVILIGLAL